MVLLPRREQERLVVQFEREYGTLVRLVNEEKCSPEEFNSSSLSLATSMFKMARPSYFDADILDHLVNLSQSIKENLQEDNAKIILKEVGKKSA